MEWISVEEKKPKHRQDCIVLTDDGRVSRAIAHKDWSGGFCQGDGKSGVCVGSVTHWMKFEDPNLFSGADLRHNLAADSAKTPEDADPT